jgi:tRNA threonylcarbamoyladenosine biosynthesis protein TsaE
VNEYGGGRLRLFHLDLYRLETPEQIVAAGLEEFLQPDGVTVVEWAEKFSGLAPGGVGSGNFVKVKIEIVGATERKITYDNPGA